MVLDQGRSRDMVDFVQLTSVVEDMNWIMIEEIMDYLTTAVEDMMSACKMV